MRESTEQYRLMCSFDIRLHRHFFPQFFFKIGVVAMIIVINSLIGGFG